jgi:uroporphyrin-III C-methyltransferase / precorrin-2 dehydrogenase / sirohydrochlorin ferrochelatase
MDYFPLFLKLRAQRVVLIGGGNVAARKFALLHAAGADVTLIAPELHPALQLAKAADQLHWIREKFAAQHLEGARLVIAACDDRAVNAAVAEAAKALGIWVNVVDDTERSDAIVPAIVDRNPIIVAISSAGTAPVLATDIRGRIEAMLDHSPGALAKFAARFRRTVGAQIRDNDQRRRFWRGLLSGEVAQALRQGQHDRAEALLHDALKLAAHTPTQGRVLLVGAGPGDPGLLTLRAHRALQDADVVLYDRLVSAEVRAMGRRDAEWIEVGKRHGQADTIQHDIARLLVEHARAGKIVVRLKGGDPLLFARAEEELQVLKDHAIPFEIIPGITSASACAAYAGIPLTARGSADGVRLVTAAHCQTGHEPDWQSLARSDDTLVIYMGVASIANSARELMRHGRSRKTPVAMIENGSRSDQRVIVSTLAHMAAAAQMHELKAPALLIIGEQAERALKFGWFGAPVIDARSAQPSSLRAAA